MKCKLILLTLLTLLIPALARPVAGSSSDVQLRGFLPLALNGTVTSTSTPPTTLAEIQAETIRLINIERVNVGCPAAAANPALMTATQAWSDYMDAHNYYEHSVYIDPTWYPDHGYLPDASENIAQGQRSPAEVVAAWMDDTAHRKTILFCVHASEGYVYDIGVGVHIAPNGTGLWTMAVGERLP